MRRLIPRERRFFDDFERQSQFIVRAATLLHTLVTDFADVPAAVQAIRNVEHAGDQLVHEIIARLHVTFLTPVDRHDLHGLATRLDDVLDEIDAAGSALLVYRVKRPTPECRALSEAVAVSVGSLHDAVTCLRSFDATFYRHAASVHAHEHRADQLLRHSLASLFELGGDPIEVLKWKEIYEMLEGVTDRCEDVTNTIEAIMLKEGVGP
jgi:hypothetical protein